MKKKNSNLIMIKEIRDKVTCTENWRIKIGRFERTGLVQGGRENSVHLMRRV